MSAAAALARQLVLLCLLPAAATAQQAAAPHASDAPARGMLTAQALKALPESFTLRVSPYDDSEVNLQLKDDFEARLGEHGRASIAGESEAAFLLLFETKLVPAEQAPQPPSLGSARASAGVGGDPVRNSDGADVEVDVNVNVWSSSRDSMLGGRQERAALGSSVFHINAILRNQSSGEVVWQGDAYYVLSEPQTERVARAMVAPLVDRIGQSVVREPFEID